MVPVDGDDFFGQGSAPITHRLYFHLACGGVLASAGAYESALEQYGEAEGVLDGFPEGHPNR